MARPTGSWKRWLTLAIVVASASFIWEARGEKPLSVSDENVETTPAESFADSVEAIVEGIDHAKLMEHVRTLADDTMEGRKAGSRGGRAASNYVISRLEKAGLTPLGERGGWVQDFRGSMRNVLAIVEGSDPDLRHEAIVLSAHYDHVGTGTAKNSFGPLGYIHNGADDNASGTAAVIEVATALQAMSVKPKRSVVIAFWDGEEDGLFGSAHWCEHPTWPRERIVGMLNIDMIGRMVDSTLEIHASRSSTLFRKMCREENETLGLKLTFPWKLIDDSDHWEFYKRGIPTIMLHTGLHKDYHRPSDDVELIDVKGLTASTRMCARLILRWADMDQPPTFRVESKPEGTAQQQNLEARSRPAARLGMRWRVESANPPSYVIEQVVPGAAAARAGLRPGDRLTGLDDGPLVDESDLKLRVATASHPLRLTVRRLGAAETTTVEVKLDGPAWPLGFAWRHDPGDPTAIVVHHVFEESPAARSGLASGDRVLSSDDAPLTTAEAWRKELETAHAEGRWTGRFERAGRVDELTIDESR